MGVTLEDEDGNEFHVGSYMEFHNSKVMLVRAAIAFSEECLVKEQSTFEEDDYDIEWYSAKKVLEEWLPKQLDVMPLCYFLDFSLVSTTCPNSLTLCSFTGLHVWALASDSDHVFSAGQVYDIAESLEMIIPYLQTDYQELGQGLYQFFRKAADNKSTVSL